MVDCHVEATRQRGAMVARPRMKGGESEPEAERHTVRLTHLISVVSGNCAYQPNQYAR